MQPNKIHVSGESSSSTISHFDHDVVAIVGVHEHERINPQPLIIRASITHDDNLCSIAELIDDYFANNKPLLLEALVYQLSLSVMNKLPQVSAMSLTVEKPRAVSSARAAVVTLVSERTMLVPPYGR